MVPKNVQPGDMVLAAWNAVLASMRSLTILPGRGILLTRHPSGCVINSRSAVYGFSGAWKVSVGDKAIMVSRGFVNGLEPMVGSKLLSEATIPYNASGFTAGRMWVGLKIRIDTETGKMKASTQAAITERDLTVVVQSSPVSGDSTGATGFHPLALIIEKPAIRPVQIAFFDYQHSTAKKKPGTGLGWRHYFHAA